MSVCIICSGSGAISLPVRRHAYASYSRDISCEPIQEAYRTYACPECQEKQTAEEKVHFLYAEERFRAYGETLPEGAERHILRSLANISARMILQDGLMEIRQETRGDDIVFRSRVGVVHPRVVERIDARALSKMKEFLGDVVDKASEEIAQWGSYYSGTEGPIEKAQAIRFVRQAFDRHIADTESVISEFSSKRGESQ